MGKKNMKKEGSMEAVLDCVLPYVHDPDDLLSISLVSRTFFELDSITRKRLTVHLSYAQTPTRLSKRFPFVESLTLKGLPSYNHNYWDDKVSATPWIQGISVMFQHLKALHMRGLLLSDQDLELLAKTRGKDLRALKILDCKGFSENGLLHLSQNCNALKTLCLENKWLGNRLPVGKANGEWLRELASRNTPIESLHLRYDNKQYDVENFTLLAEKCRDSLVSLKISPKPLNHLRDAFSHAINLQVFDGVILDKDEDYTSFSFPPPIRALGIESATSFSFLFPYVNQLRELDLTCHKYMRKCTCILIQSCPNLEVLRTNDECGDRGLRFIGKVCKKLRKLVHLERERVTQLGLIDLVQGCTSLEVLDVQLSDISNEAIECVGTYLKNLRKLRMRLFKEEGTDDLPLDDGIRAMLKGCIKLERLTLYFYDNGLTNVGLGYIGKYGINLRHLYISWAESSLSGQGLMELSKGCPKLRKLYLWNCGYPEEYVATVVFNIDTLRYALVKNNGYSVLVLTRPTITAEVMKKLQRVKKQLW